MNGGSGQNQEQWYLYNDGDMNDDDIIDGRERADIHAPEAWSIQTGRSDVILSFSDSGIEWNHDDLKDNLWINPHEDANENGIFENYSIVMGGDFGDVNGDGCPGDCGVDDDGDGFTGFNDPGVYSIYTNGKDDDNDGTAEDELGGNLDDSPGIVGVDDDGDGDGIADDYDGAIFDDDENGFADDVIGFDFAQWDPEPEPAFGNYHGTSVAGDMAATTDNNTGIAGVAWNCKIMTTGIFGGQWRASEAIYYCVKNGAHVHNMSWAGPVTSTVLEEVYNNYNMLLIAAAGNRNENPSLWPSLNSNVMSIAGTNSYDEKYYQNDSAGSAYGTQIELCAAHKPITIVWANNGYAGFGSGTSHSSPIVAGVAGLVISELL